MSNRDEQRILLLRGLDRIALLQRLDDFCDDGSNVLFPVFKKMCRDAAAEIRAEHADAERYRWLRKQYRNDALLCVVTNPKENLRLGAYCPCGELLDEAIDAARKASGGTP